MERNLRIAVFGQKRLSREGGVEIVVKELCTRMAQQGCQVTCYNRSGHHVSGAEYDDIDNTNYEGIRQKYVPTIEKKGLAAVSASAFAALYSAFGKYDVVHIHAEGPAFFSWLPKMFGKRVVVTVHGIDWQREKWQSGLGSKFIHQGEKNAAKYADEVIVLSKGVQGYFKETYGRETHFIPNGVNRPQIREASLITDKFGLKKDSYILFLGRLVPEKGIRYLVEAFKNVKTDKKLVIAGGSSDIPGCTMVFNNCLMRKIQERKPEFDLITMHDCWLYYICLGIGGKIISDKNAYIQYRQHGNNVIGAKRISIRKKIQMICQQNGSPRAKMIDEIIRLYGQDMKKEMLSKYKTFASYPKSIKAKNYFFKQSTENVFSTRELQKAKLRILFGSL